MFSMFKSKLFTFIYFLFIYFTFTFHTRITPPVFNICLQANYSGFGDLCATQYLLVFARVSILEKPIFLHASDTQ